MVDTLDDGLSRLNVLGVAWGFDLDSFSHKRAQQAPTTGDTDDGTAETMGVSQGGAVEASSVHAGRTETAEMMGSFQGGAVDAPLVPAGRAESDPGAVQPPTPTKGTMRIPPPFCRGEQHTSSASGLSATVRGRVTSNA